eukprot:10907352-Lingulodinium_polyedra.AAC.1
MALWVSASWGAGRPNRSAAELAWELVELEAAEVAGEAVAGVALDWSKAFDRIPLGSVGPALRRAG